MSLRPTELHSKTYLNKQNKQANPIVLRGQALSVGLGVASCQPKQRENQAVPAPLLFQAMVLQRGRPVSGYLPQHLGSPDPTQEMGLPPLPRSSVVSGLRPGFQGKQCLAFRSRHQTETGLSSSRWGNQWSLGSESSVEKAFPVASFWPAMIEKVGPAGSFPYWPLASYPCPCSCLACVFLYVQHTIGKTTQTASLRNCLCPSLPCQRDSPSQHAWLFCECFYSWAVGLW